MKKNNNKQTVSEIGMTEEKNKNKNKKRDFWQANN